MKRNRNTAVFHAQSVVSPLEWFNNGWRYYVVDHDTGLRRESGTHPYHLAMAHRSQSLLDAALDFLSLPRMQYQSGSWIRHIPDENTVKAAVQKRATANA